MHIGRVVLLSTLVLQFFQGRAISEAGELHHLTTVRLSGETQRISLRSTDRLPEASGAVTVERRGGTTGIDLALESMKPASLFGGDYNTYVLWIVPPRGQAINAGEITLEGDKGGLKTPMPLSEFAIMVTAEPHYLADRPSSFVIAENAPDPNGLTIQQPLASGIYNFSRSTLEGAKEARGKVHSGIRQAFTAVRLAARSGAATFAPAEFDEAQNALQQLLALRRQRSGANEFAVQARETVRLAVAAQRLAENRALQELSVSEGSGGGKGGSFRSAISEDIVTR